MSSDESEPDLPEVNFYSTPLAFTDSRDVIVLEPDIIPAENKEMLISRRLRSSTRHEPTNRGVVKKTQTKRGRKPKKKENAAETQPEISIIDAEDLPTAPNDDTGTKKKKVHPSKAIRIVEEVVVTGSIKLSKGPLKLAVDLDPELQDKWYLSGLGGEAARAGLPVRPDHALSGSGLLLWTKAVPSTLTSVHGNVELTPPEVRCSHGLYVSEMEEAVKRVSEKELVEHMKKLEGIARCKLSLVLFGYKEYFKTACKRYRVVSEFDIETAIADLIVSINCDTIIVNEPSDLVMTVMQFHKGFANFYKKDTCAEEEQADFYMKGFNKKCVGVDKDGAGLARLWQQMVAILPKSSLETARALCAKYPSPAALCEAFTAPMGLETISGLFVSRTGAPGSRPRRIGPELARKLKTIFTERDGSIIAL